MDLVMEIFVRGIKMFFLVCVEDIFDRLIGKVIKDNKYSLIFEMWEYLKMCL